MVDLLTLVIALLVVLVVMLRKTSAGVAILALLAGVMLDQLLAEWLTGLLPSAPSGFKQYIPVIIHLLVTFAPVVVALIAVKVHRHNLILSVLASLLLGFLLVYFGVKIVEVLPAIERPAKNAGLLHFLQPFQNTILASSAVVALIEMVLSHRQTKASKKSK